MIVFDELSLDLVKQITKKKANFSLNDVLFTALSQAIQIIVNTKNVQFWENAERRRAVVPCLCLAFLTKVITKMIVSGIKCKLLA